jgi:hypothetical protein
VIATVLNTWLFLLMTFFLITKSNQNLVVDFRKMMWVSV